MFYMLIGLGKYAWPLLILGLLEVQYRGHPGHFCKTIVSVHFWELYLSHSFHISHAVFLVKGHGHKGHFDKNVNMVFVYYIENCLLQSLYISHMLIGLSVARH